MIGSIIAGIAKGLIAPATDLGREWIAMRKSREVQDQETTRATIEAGAAYAVALTRSSLGMAVLAVLLVPINVHVAAVFIDSTWPSDWINPLALPSIYQTIMEAAVIGQVGVAAWRTVRR